MYVVLLQVTLLNSARVVYSALQYRRPATIFLLALSWRQPIAFRVVDSEASRSQPPTSRLYSYCMKL